MDNSGKNNELLEKNNSNLNKDNKNKKYNKKATIKSRLVTMFVPTMFWVVVFICIVIILIGIIMFFSTMPGMAVQKLKKIFNNLGNYVAEFFGADATKQVDSQEIFNALDYIEDMGYDLKGFGFLTYYYNLNDKDEIENEIPEEFKNEEFKDRSMLVKKIKMLPVECIVRGYITGSRMG